jgi:hypothetical protein
LIETGIREQGLGDERWFAVSQVSEFETWAQAFAGNEKSHKLPIFTMTHVSEIAKKFSELAQISTILVATAYFGKASLNFDSLLFSAGIRR